MRSMTSGINSSLCSDHILMWYHFPKWSFIVCSVLMHAVYVPRQFIERWIIIKLILKFLDITYLQPSFRTLTTVLPLFLSFRLLVSLLVWRCLG